MLVRCAISALMPAPGDLETAKQLRDQARPLWRRVSFKDKEDWKILNEARVSDPDVYKKGGRLIKKQGLLAQLKPKSTVTANVSDPQQDIAKPAVTELATTSHLTARDRSSVESDSTSSSPPTGPARVESARSPSIAANDAACPQSKSYPTNPFHIPANCSGETKISVFFPQMTQATSTTPKGQPCYVPFIPRPGMDRNCVFVVNTPDTNTGKLTTSNDLQTACRKQAVSGLLNVYRCNENVFTAYFKGYEEALSTRQSLIRTLPSTAGGSVSVKARFHAPRRPRIFFCDVTELAIEHATVPSRVLEALRGHIGGSSMPCQLLLQETPKSDDNQKRYLLRFDEAQPFEAPWVQCFYIPLDDKSGKEEVWGVFTPVNIHGTCPFCHKRCQIGKSSTYPFGRVVGFQ